MEYEVYVEVTNFVGNTARSYLQFTFSSPSYSMDTTSKSMDSVSVFTSTSRSSDTSLISTSKTLTSSSTAGNWTWTGSRTSSWTWTGSRTSSWTSNQSTFTFFTYYSTSDPSNSETNKHGLIAVLLIFLTLLLVVAILGCIAVALVLRKRKTQITIPRTDNRRQVLLDEEDNIVL